jgi:hypothetical protein
MNIHLNKFMIMQNLRFHLTTILFFGFLMVVSSQGLPPGWEFQVTPSNHVVAIPLSANPNINGRPLDPGDWIGVFYTNDQGSLVCGGATEWNGAQNAGIIAFGNDPFTPGKNGFSNGEVFTFKVYSWFHGCDFFAEVTCNDSLPTTCQQYFGNGLSGVATLDATGFFQPVWESPYNPMTFYIVEAAWNSEPLQHCDEVGIFDTDANTGEEICVGVGILSEPLGGEVFLEIIASMDDGTTPGQANGFTPGNGFIFKFYSREEGLLDAIEFAFPYPGYDEVFTALGSTIVSLSGNAATNQEHTLPLENGWNGISSFLSPANPAITYVTQNIAEQLLMMNDPEAFYQPGNPAGTLAEWNYQSGYFIKVDENTSLTIIGQPPANAVITLEQGWNLMPVLTDEPITIETLFGENLTSVAMIREAIGLGVYWPAKAINSLQSLQPGKAYLVKASQEFEIVW